MTLEPAVTAGDLEGKESVYTSEGNLVTMPRESVLLVTTGWDMHVWSPWRRVHPKVIFLGFNPKAASRLYITSSRIVLIRDIDPWRQVAGEMTPLGFPTAIAKELELKGLKTAGIRQFCDIRPASLRVAQLAQSARRGSWLRVRVEDLSGVRYTITYWKTDGKDDKTLTLLESQFHH